MYIVPGKLNANSIFHIFLISKDGGEFGAWDLQFSNNDNLYELHGFKEDTNYFLLVVSFGDDVVISPNLIHFFKLTNGKKIVRSIPLDDDHQENRYRKPVKRYAI